MSSALIASTSREWHLALSALLESVSAVDAIYHVSDTPALLQTITSRQPALIIVDFVLCHITLFEQANCMVMVENRDEYSRARQGGIRWIFQKGTPVGQLVAAIEKILDEQS